MKKTKILQVVIFFITTFYCFSQVETFDFRVVSVKDGDTLDVINSIGKKYTIVLKDIDAPELSQTFGKQAKEALSNVVLNKKITADIYALDENTNLISTIFSDKGMNINKSMVEYGYAWTCSAEDEYIVAENNAKASQKGLWKYKAIAPWNYKEAVAREKQSFPTQEKYQFKRKITLNKEPVDVAKIGASSQSSLVSRPVNEEIREQRILNDQIKKETKGMRYDVKSDYTLYRKLVAQGTDPATAMRMVETAQKNRASREQQNALQAIKSDLHKIKSDVKDIKNEVNFGF